jgi:hypothetical protein
VCVCVCVCVCVPFRYARCGLRHEVTLGVTAQTQTQTYWRHQIEDARRKDTTKQKWTKQDNAHRIANALLRNEDEVKRRMSKRRTKRTKRMVSEQQSIKQTPIDRVARTARVCRAMPHRASTCLNSAPKKKKKKKKNRCWNDRWDCGKTGKYYSKLSTKTKTTYFTGR